MRKGEHVELNDELTERVIDRERNIPAGNLLTYYLVSYLPIISDSLASIADSLEILTKESEESDKKGDK